MQSSVFVVRIENLSSLNLNCLPSISHYVWKQIIDSTIEWQEIQTKALTAHPAKCLPPTANTDALLDPIPEVLTKTVELSSNLPPRLADVQTNPNSISEELHSANIDASLVNTRDVVAEEADVSIDCTEAVAGTTTNSTVGDDAPPLVNDSVQLSMNDGSDAVAGTTTNSTVVMMPPHW